MQQTKDNMNEMIKENQNIISIPKQYKYNKGTKGNVIKKMMTID